MHVAARRTGDQTRPHFSRATIQELGDFALPYGVPHDLSRTAAIFQASDFQAKSLVAPELSAGLQVVVGQLLAQKLFEPLASSLLRTFS